MTLIAELKRRGVFRASLIYAAGAFGAIEILDWLISSLGIEAPGWLMPAVAIVFVAGLPVAAYLAWVTDIEQRPVYTLTAAALILVGSSLALFFTVDPVIGSTPRLAVLPPTGVADGQDGPDEIALWSTNDLRDLLEEIDQVEVVGRTTTVMTAMDPVSLVTQLVEFGTTNVVRSELTRGKGRLQYTVTLESMDGGVLWSETYNGAPLDLFEFQKAAVEGIAGALGVPASAAGLRIIRLRQDPTRELSAFEAVARGEARQLAGDPFCEQAMEHFQEAVEADPEMGRAYFGIGYCRFLQAWLPELPRDDPKWEAAVQHFRRAAKLDPSMAAEALVFIAHAQAARNRWREARLALGEARAIDPEAFSFVLANSTGYCAEVVEYMEARYALDPLDPVNAGMVGAGYLTCPGIIDPDEGLYWSRLACEISNGNFCNDRAIPALLEKGDVETARRFFEHANEVFGGTGEMIDLAIKAIENPAKNAELVAHLRAAVEEGRIRDAVATYEYIRIGEADLAYEGLFRNIENNAFNIHDFMQYGPGPRKVRDDPRYMEVLQRIGLVDYWREYGLPPICEEQPGGEILCR
jgi:TolB-like protein